MIGLSDPAFLPLSNFQHVYNLQAASKIDSFDCSSGFVSNMLNMGMDDGHLFLKFYCLELVLPNF